MQFLRDIAKKILPRSFIEWYRRRRAFRQYLGALAIEVYDRGMRLEVEDLEGRIAARRDGFYEHLVKDVLERTELVLQQLDRKIEGVSARHGNELRALQQEVEAVLRPRSRRNDPHSRVQASRQRLVVNAWYSWAQEFFCDAIGLSIGGPAFLHSFSNYLSRLVKEDFYQPESDLRHGAHPVTWLRIKFLIRRAGAMGLLQDAQEVDEEWAAVAQALQAREEYHGFYEDALQGAVERTVSDMLTEADPRPFRADEAEAGRDWQPGDSPILLLNRAWRAFISDPQNYARWEADAVQRFLTALG